MKCANKLQCFNEYWALGIRDKEQIFSYFDET